MKKIKSMLLGAILVASSGIAIAAPKNAPHQLLEKIIQCKASMKDLEEFNDLVDQQKIPFPESKTVSVWGGKAWNVSPPIRFGDVVSGVVVMSDRDSLYLRVQTKGDVQAEMRRVAKNMGIPAQTSDNASSYMTDTSPANKHIQSSDEKDVYWVGCSYDNPARPWG